MKYKLIHKTLALFCYFFLLKLSAQERKEYSFEVNYKMTYKRDTLSNNFYSENFRLFFNSDESYYAASKIILRDSLTHTKEVLDLSKSMKLRTRYADQILKSDKETVSIFKYENAFYGYDIEDNSDWQITNNTKTIKGIECREATKTFLGRKWIAYFSESYPFPFGPYLFNGLPGLIIYVEDEQKTYQFVFGGIEKKNQEIIIPNKHRKVSEKEYFKLIYDLYFSSAFFETFSIVGNPEEKNKLRKAFEENTKKFNNYPINKNMRFIFQ